MITVEQITNLLGCDHDKVRIFDGNIEIFRGYLFDMTDYDGRWQDIRKREVKRQRFHLDIKHKEWRERNLMPPLEPDAIASYQFSDLQVELYIELYL